MIIKMVVATKGSATSGNMGHAGRPGKVGGSAPKGTSPAPVPPNVYIGALKRQQASYQSTQGSIPAAEYNRAMEQQMDAYLKSQGLIRDYYTGDYYNKTTGEIVDPNTFEPTGHYAYGYGPKPKNAGNVVRNVVSAILGEGRNKNPNLPVIPKDLRKVRSSERNLPKLPRRMS